MLNRYAYLALSAALLSSACAYPMAETLLAEQPQTEVKTAVADELLTLPPPQRQLAVAVYTFTDQTGQNKPNTEFSEYSRAVTQGGSSILVNALKKAGNNAWFKVVERTSLPALLQERQIIRQTREAYGGQNLTPLPPLSYAGLLLDGGIIGYDSNTLTGGFGARFLGIGGDVQYRRDTVTIYIRAISVQSGEVLKSVSTSKTIYSVGGRGGAFRFVDFKELLEIETGITTNEPVLLAVRQAIEKGVMSLIMEGVLDDYWSFRDPNQRNQYLTKYLREREGIYDVERIVAPAEVRNATPPAPPQAMPPSGAPQPVPRVQQGGPPQNGINIPPPPRTEPDPSVPQPPGLPSAVNPEGAVQTPPPQQPTYVVPGQDGFTPVPGGVTPRQVMPSPPPR